MNSSSELEQIERVYYAQRARHCPSVRPTPFSDFYIRISKCRSSSGATRSFVRPAVRLFVVHFNSERANGPRAGGSLESAASYGGGSILFPRDVLTSCVLGCHKFSSPPSRPASQLFVRSVGRSGHWYAFLACVHPGPATTFIRRQLTFLMRRFIKPPCR